MHGNFRYCKLCIDWFHLYFAYFVYQKKIWSEKEGLLGWIPANLFNVYFFWNRVTSTLYIQTLLIRHPIMSTTNRQWWLSGLRRYLKFKYRECLRSQVWIPARDYDINSLKLETMSRFSNSRTPSDMCCLRGLQHKVQKLPSK